MTEPSPSPAAEHRRPGALLVAVLFAAVITPTLGWLDFANTPEKLVVETALEIRRGASWVAPTLDGVSRTVKPPLASWITAIMIGPTTLGDLASPNVAARHSAYDRLAFLVRLPAMLCMALMILATARLGRILADGRLGLLAAIICASSLLLCRETRTASTDAPLALFVTLANVHLALALLENRRWHGLLGAGLFVGLGCMTKGPVVLVQTILPFLLWAIWCRRKGVSLAGRSLLLPSLCAALLFLAICLPWPLAMVRQHSNQWIVWWLEITGNDSPERSEPWYRYAELLPVVFLPWTLFLMIGLLSPPPAAGRRRGGLGLAVLLLLAPILVMSFFKDKKDRYLLPMIPAGALVAAAGLRRCAEPGPDQPPWGRAAIDVHWVAISAVCFGLPIAGAIGLPTVRTVWGQPWYSVGLAIGAAAVFTVVIMAAVRRSRGSPLRVAGFTMALVLLLEILFLYGYRDAPTGRSEMRALADDILAVYPDARVFGARPRRTDRLAVDLSIYLDRAIPPVGPDAVTSLPRAERPAVAIFVEYDTHSRPPPLPPPWRPFTRRGYDNEIWYLYMLPAAVREPGPR